jgi:hypothetical protein
MTVLTGSFFYIPCDTVFFNLFAKAFLKVQKDTHLRSTYIVIFLMQLAKTLTGAQRTA